MPISNVFKMVCHINTYQLFVTCRARVGCTLPSRPDENMLCRMLRETGVAEIFEYSSEIAHNFFALVHTHI